MNKLPHFKHASILVIGDIMLDRYWFGETARISPEAPVPIVKIKQIDERPGGAANVALNISALGSKVILLGVTGDDAAATSLKTQLTTAGVQHELLDFADVPTITKLRVISRHQQLIRLDFEESFLTFDNHMLLEIYKKYLTTVDLVILSDYGKGTLSSAQTFITLAQAARIPLFVDPKGLDFSQYQGATAITPNFKEWEAIVGPLDNTQVIADKAQAFLKKQNIQYLLLTRGEYGMTLIQRDQEAFHLSAHAREVFDVTGAGDTVIAVFGAAFASGAELHDAVRLANLAASLVVAKLGATSVSYAELAAALRTDMQLSSGIIEEDQLLQIATDARLQGKKIVFTNGCFDILHAGHVAYLQQAKQLGDFLIVAINDDASVQRLKGSNRPINDVTQRMAVLSSLGVVDCVTSFADDTPERLLKRLQPDILVKGGDYSLDQVVGADIVLAYGGEVRVLGLVKSVSTSSIIDRVNQVQETTQQV